MRHRISLSRPRLWRTRAATALAAAGALVMGTGIVVLAAVPATATEGNNGTIKVGGSEAIQEGATDNPDNEPFVNCEFLIQWYNYTLPERSTDGDVDFTVSFEPWSPTSGRTIGVTGVTTGSFNTFDTGESEPPNPDHAEKYSLAISGLPHKEGAKQGYHVKVTINTEYSQGNDVKHKVFWYRPCQPQSTQSSTDQTRMTCAGGVEKQTTTVIREYVWGENGWVLEPEANFQTIVGDWTFVRALTSEERARLGCDQPNPLVDSVSESDASCELGYRSRTGTVTKEYVWDGNSWVLEPSSQWSTSWNAWSAYRPLTDAEFEQLGCRPDQPDPVVTPLSDERASCADGVETRTGTQTTTSVWNPTTRSYDSVVGPNVWGDWEFERALTAAEAIELDCVLGEETVVPEPKPENEPTVKGVEVVRPPAAAPTAVAAGIGSASASPTAQLVGQLLVGGGMLLLLAAGWLGLGRREGGAHEA